jgi:hypothetical protein
LGSVAGAPVHQLSTAWLPTVSELLLHAEHTVEVAAGHEPRVPHDSAASTTRESPTSVSSIARFRAIAQPPANLGVRKRGKRREGIRTCQTQIHFGIAAKSKGQAIATEYPPIAPPPMP